MHWLSVLSVLFFSTVSGTSLCEPKMCEQHMCTCCFVPVPKFCDTYCYCRPNAVGPESVVEVKCPENESFDPELRICLPSDLSNCKEIPPSGLNCKNLTNGNYPYPGRCDIFVQCSNGFEYIQHCADGLHFCQSTNQCEYPNTVCDSPCGRTCVEGNLYPNDQDCHSFFLCAGSKLRKMSCGPRLHWCDKCTEQRCEHPELAQCVTKKSQHASAAEAIRHRVQLSPAHFLSPLRHGKTFFNCTLPDGNYAVPSHPTAYLSCRNGLAALHKCPLGHEFQQETNGCIQKHSVIQLTQQECSFYNDNFVF